MFSAGIIPYKPSLRSGCSRNYTYGYTEPLTRILQRPLSAQLNSSDYFPTFFLIADNTSVCFVAPFRIPTIADP